MPTAPIYYEVPVGPDDYLEHTAHVEYECSPYDPGYTSGPPERCRPPEGGEVEVVNVRSIPVDHGEERGVERVTLEELLGRIARDHGSTVAEAERWIEDRLEEHHRGEVEDEACVWADRVISERKDEGRL